MICKVCSAEFDGDAKFCPECGAPIQDTVINDAPPEQAVPNGQLYPSTPEMGMGMINPLLAKTDALIKDKLYLALCILMTVVCALPLAKGLKAGINIPSIIITVFLWILYSEKNKQLPDAKRIRIISGCVYAAKVISYVISGIVFLAGILCFFSSAKWIDMFTDAFSGNAYADSAFDAVFSLGGGVIGTIFIFVAVLLAVLTFFSYGKIHKFVKSCYENIQSNTNALENRNITYVWMIVFAVFSGLGALSSVTSSPLTAVIYGCETAVAIMVALLIKKYYSEY
ncbi:MAG: zinc ribbon domain-containing protein [Ruminococcaceae bacterium]|nr:zinc ribbon domain-containing protein [Oscillospiraceae bacterium]